LTTVYTSEFNYYSQPSKRCWGMREDSNDTKSDCPKLLSSVWNT